mmetsp:Transcript_5714/g.9661  ORF Transcript_5714/g.9661 Transcript_5714/m.9661 type:complete len:318 (+) Transcript_5714:392-1345(+)
MEGVQRSRAAELQPVHHRRGERGWVAGDVRGFAEPLPEPRGNPLHPQAPQPRLDAKSVKCHGRSRTATATANCPRYRHHRHSSSGGGRGASRLTKSSPPEQELPRGVPHEKPVRRCRVPVPVVHQEPRHPAKHSRGGARCGGGEAGGAEGTRRQRVRSRALEGDQVAPRPDPGERKPLQGGGVRGDVEFVRGHDGSSRGLGSRGRHLPRHPRAPRRHLPSFPSAPATCFACASNPLLLPSTSRRRRKKRSSILLAASSAAAAAAAVGLLARACEPAKESGGERFYPHRLLLSWRSLASSEQRHPLLALLKTPKAGGL